MYKYIIKHIDFLKRTSPLNALLLGFAVSYFLMMIVGLFVSLLIRMNA